MMSPRFSIQQTTWAASQAELQSIRQRVFIDEQGVPESLEWDADDATALHFLAWQDAQAVGCARLLPDGQVGRMAVLPRWRGQGAGRALLDAVVAAARAQGHIELKLSAQTHAAGFYARAGWLVRGEVYEEAGIPHIAMWQSLTVDGTPCELLD